MLYYGDKYRKMKLLENYIIFYFFLFSDIRNLESRKKKTVEIDFFFRTPTLDLR